MSMNRVKMSVAGMDFTITTDEDPAYMSALGGDLNNKINRILRENDNISVTLAAMLVALDYSDKFVKTEDSADNLRKQLKEYLEESSSSRLKTDSAKREIDRLNREIEALKAQLADKK